MKIIIKISFMGLLLSLAGQVSYAAESPSPAPQKSATLTSMTTTDDSTASSDQNSLNKGSPTTTNDTINDTPTNTPSKPLIVTAHQLSEIIPNPAGAITLSLAGGFYHFAHKRQLNNTTVPDLSFAYNFDEHWAAELSWVTFATSQKATDGQSTVGNLFMLNGIYRFKAYRHVLQPYLTGGVGNIGFKHNRGNSSQQGIVDGGVGLQFFADNFVALRADVRDVYSTTQGANDYMGTLGVSFLIDT